jgi:hypothetical protein
VKTLRYHLWLYNEENKHKEGKIAMLTLGGFKIDFEKEQAKRLLPPNVIVKPSKNFNQMMDLINGR